MGKNKRYMIYRKYSREERSEEERFVFWGWSSSRDAVLGFLRQRSHKKYKIVEIKMSEMFKIYGEDDLDEDSRLNMVTLLSAKTRKPSVLFTTQIELNETKKKIQRMFRDAASLGDVCGSDTVEVLHLFMRIKPYYASALYFIGFRPPEVDAMYDSADYHDDYSGIESIEEEIDSEHADDTSKPTLDPFRSSIVDDVSKKIIYSLESFIAILKDDM